MTKIILGFNCNCFTNRYDEPEQWPVVCADMGIRHVMFNIDLIDPYWPWDLQKKLCDRTLASCSRHNIKIHCSFGGHHGHQHYLGHPDKDCRRQAENFLRKAIRQTAYLGGKSFGTCFAIQTVHCQNDLSLRKAVMDDAIEAYHRLAEYGAEQGLSALAYEMTSIPRESCATFEENDYVLQRCANMAIPMRICLDMGHRNLNGNKEEADHLAWIRRYGQYCDVIDCQQSDLNTSRHWPFTPEYNKKGVVKAEEVVAAINDSEAQKILLVFEIKVSAFYPQEYNFLNVLKTSVEYWRNWVKE